MRLLLSLAFFATTACVSADPAALKDYPDGFLCQLLDSNQYVSTPQEQINIYRELERRNLTCGRANTGAINQTVVIN